MIHAMKMRPEYRPLLPGASEVPRDHRKLKDGTAITDPMVEKMADEAETGYDSTRSSVGDAVGVRPWVRGQPASSPSG